MWRFAKHNLQLGICFLSCNLESCHKINMGLIPLHRLKTSERLFIHKNLLLSLGLGNLIFVLDKSLFASRRDHVVCTKLRKSFFKQIASFTLDLLLSCGLKEKAEIETETILLTRLTNNVTDAIN